MGIELTTLVAHANFSGANQTENSQIFTNQLGAISDRSGLGFFKYHFSPSAKNQENRATLQDFKQSISQSPAYGALLENEQISTFFCAKHKEGTPLTAKEVRQVGLMLTMGKASIVGQELVAAQTLHNLDATSFSWFCSSKGLSLTTPQEIKNALKEFYANNYCDAKAKTVLEQAGVKPKHLENSLQLLKANPAWSSAMEQAFEGGLETLKQAAVLDAFGTSLREAAALVSSVSSKPKIGSAIFRNICFPGNTKGMNLFNKTLQAISSGVISVDEGPAFMVITWKNGLTISSPEVLSKAITDYCLTTDAEPIFKALAQENGLPEAAGKALADHPEFLALAKQALYEASSPSALGTRQQIDMIISNGAATFLAEKNAAINKFLALPATKSPCAAQLTGTMNALDEKSICEMLNPLLAGEALVSTLLDARKGMDLDFINALVNYQHAVASCQHMVKSDFGAAEAADTTSKVLTVLLGMRQVDEEMLGTLLGRVNTEFPKIGLGLASIDKAVRGKKLAENNSFSAGNAINNAQSAMRRVAYFFYDAASAADRERLNISNQDTFSTSLELNSSGYSVRLETIHQSVRAFGASLGLKITQKQYAENILMAKSEALAFTGTTIKPLVTELLQQRAKAIATEIGLAHFDPATLDPIPLGQSILHSIDDKNQTVFTPAQAREVAEQAIREHLQALKPALDFVRALPTEYTKENTSQYVISPAEKECLLRIIPGTSLRTPALITRMLKESQSSTLSSSVNSLLQPGLSIGEMANGLLALPRIDAFTVTGAVGDEVDGAYKAALILALEKNNPTPAQRAELFEKISSPLGIKLGGCFVSMGEILDEQPKNSQNTQTLTEKRAKIMGGLAAMLNLRLILGQQLGKDVQEDPFYYSEKVERHNIPGELFEAANGVRIRPIDLPGYSALAWCEPKLTQQEFAVLLPILHAVGQHVKDTFTYNTLTKILAANSLELLAATAANKGNQLSPQQIWKIVLGEKAPVDIQMETMGVKLCETLEARMLQRALALNPATNVARMVLLIPGALRQGIPFQTIYNACKPDGRLSLADMRFGPPTLSSLNGYAAQDAYGLISDWRRRQTDSSGNPSMMTIHTGEGSGFSIGHMPIPDEENTPDNPIFEKIIETCRGICHSDLQFLRAMQSVSQASTILLRVFSIAFVGLELDEHGHFDSTITPQDNGDVIVKLANSENDRPYGAHIQITIRPDGEATVTDIDIVLRG